MKHTMMVNFEDEPDLQRKIVILLNKNGYDFKKTKANGFCDIIDNVNKIYVEVKPESFAPAQILYGLSVNNIQDARYIGLACAYEIRFYKCPSFNLLLDFAKKIDPKLGKSPSSVNKKEYIDAALELLGFHQCLWDYRGEFKIEEKNHEICLNENNYEYFKMLFTKYNINPAQFLSFVAYIESEGSELKINKDGKIYESKHFNMFKNQQNGYHDKQKNQKTLNGDIIHGEQDIRPVKDKHDCDLFESLRIRGVDIEKIIHKMDEMTPLKIRRQIGKFFSGMDLGVYLAGIITNLVKPDFILEPMVGGGSLIAPFVGKVPCVINDINKGHVDLLKQKYGYQINGYFSQDFILTPTGDIVNKWGMPKEGNVLIYTNPPFGTSSTNDLASKKGENEKGSRETKIDYAELGDEYGRGDLVIPSVARMIEVIKDRGSGYLAFFSPFGVFCGRSRYNKLLRALLKNFEFVYGEIFPGSEFNNVSKKKPISITILKYRKDMNASLGSLTYFYAGVEHKMKKSVLLKDVWNYNEGKDGDEIGTTRNDTFNNPNPKMIKTKLRNAGSQILYRNVKDNLGITIVPPELFYGLWSITVGYRSLSEYPVYFDNSCIHIPDLKRQETYEILSYAVLNVLITELINNYTEGKIGFSGMQRFFKFGGKRLTDGAKYLIDTHGNCPVGSRTIKQVFEELRAGKDPDAIDKNLRIDIRKEIEKRLDAIGYWDYLPIPDIHAGKDDDEDEKQTKLV
jgi:hypothetical protein